MGENGSVRVYVQNEKECPPDTTLREGPNGGMYYETGNRGGQANIPYQSFDDVFSSLDKQDDDPCWEGYTMVGMKEQDGEQVPNCVPEEDAKSAVDEDGNITDPQTVRQIGKSFEKGSFLVREFEGPNGQGPYSSFDECVSDLEGKVDSPEGLCATWHHQDTGSWPAEKMVPEEFTEGDLFYDQQNESEVMVTEVSDGDVHMQSHNGDQWKEDVNDLEAELEDGDMVYLPDEERTASKDTFKRRVYIEDPSEAPSDANVEEGQQGGYYYETDAGAGGGGSDVPDVIDDAGFGPEYEDGSPEERAEMTVDVLDQEGELDEVADQVEAELGIDSTEDPRASELEDDIEEYAQVVVDEELDMEGETADATVDQMTSMLASTIGT